MFGVSHISFLKFLEHTSPVLHFFLLRLLSHRLSELSPTATGRTSAYNNPGNEQDILLPRPRTFAASDQCPKTAQRQIPLQLGQIEFRSSEPSFRSFRVRRPLGEMRSEAFLLTKVGSKHGRWLILQGRLWIQ